MGTSNNKRVVRQVIGEKLEGSRFKENETKRERESSESAPVLETLRSLIPVPLAEIGVAAETIDSRGLEKLE